MTAKIDDGLGYELWYVPEFPLAEFDTDFHYTPDWLMRNEETIAPLKANIEAQGMVNPLIARYRKVYGDTKPLILVGGARLKAILQLGWTHCRVLVCGEGGRNYEGAIRHYWNTRELAALFPDGKLGINTTGLCMARCSSRKLGEMPGPDSKCSYAEKAAEGVWVTPHKF